MTLAAVFLFCLCSRITRTLEEGRGDWGLEEEALALFSGVTLTAADTTDTTPPLCPQVRGWSPDDTIDSDDDNDDVIIVRLRSLVPVRHPAACGDTARSELLWQEVGGVAPRPGGWQGESSWSSPNYYQTLIA